MQSVWDCWFYHSNGSFFSFCAPRGSSVPYQGFWGFHKGSLICGWLLIHIFEYGYYSVDHIFQSSYVTLICQFSWSMTHLVSLIVWIFLLSVFSVFPLWSFLFSLCASFSLVYSYLCLVCEVRFLIWDHLLYNCKFPFEPTLVSFYLFVYSFHFHLYLSSLKFPMIF